MCRIGNDKIRKNKQKKKQIETKRKKKEKQRLYTSQIHVFLKRAFVFLVFLNF